MTLLDEYQALPGEPEPFMKPPRRLGDIVDYQEQQIARRDAVVRLLVKALREAAGPGSIADMVGNGWREQWSDIDALLTAVERDFQEGA